MFGEVLKKFRDPSLGRQMVGHVVATLDRLTEKLGRPANFMEFCGTHTVAFSRSGVRDLLREHVNLMSGPGCPVCVTDYADIDRAIAMAQVPGVILTTFGDMMKVPGSRTSLQEEKSRGADVRVVYSPLDALQLAKENPSRPVIFLGVGFETTAPTAAMTLDLAVREGIRNFYLLSLHKVTPPAAAGLLGDPELKLDGIILPGHVSIMVGRQAWDYIGRDLGIPAAVAGFEPFDLLDAVHDLSKLILEDRWEVVNSYGRAVKEAGNPAAQGAIDRYFQLAEGSWRGIGPIPGSALKIKPEFAPWDGEVQFPVTIGEVKIPKGCICGEILKGKKTPFDCALFAKVCDPINPVGPCMVSHEGTCATYYKYERKGSSNHG